MRIYTYIPYVCMYVQYDLIVSLVQAIPCIYACSFTIVQSFIDILHKIADVPK